MIHRWHFLRDYKKERSRGSQKTFLPAGIEVIDQGKTKIRFELNMQLAMTEFMSSRVSMG